MLSPSPPQSTLCHILELRMQHSGQSFWNLTSSFIDEAFLSFLAIHLWNCAASLPSRFEIHICPFVTSYDSISLSVAGTYSRPLGLQSHFPSLYSPNFKYNIYSITNSPWLKWIHQDGYMNHYFIIFLLFIGSPPAFTGILYMTIPNSLSTLKLPTFSECPHEL